jgi:hypothetical protein
VNHKDKEKKKNIEIKIEMEKRNMNKNQKYDYNKDLSTAKMIKYLKIIHHFDFFYYEDRFLTDKAFRNSMIDSLYNKNGNKYYKGKNAIQVYNALPDSKK